MKAVALALVAVALALVALATAARADLVDRLKPFTEGLGDALVLSVGKSLPVPAASSGITFRFDPQTSAFERETEVLGQVFLERAHPIGKRKLNVSVTYQYVETDLLEGHDLRLADLRPIRDIATGATFVIPRLNVSLVTHDVTTSVTYGLTDDLDVNLTVPVLFTSFDVSGRLLQLESGRIQGGDTADNVAGIGDIFVRAKYRLLHGRFGELAAGLLFRLPSGNEEDFQGTGLFEVSPRLYASTPALALTPLVHVQAHVNAGVDFVPQDGSRGEGRYGFGVDVIFASRATLSAAFLGREPFGRLVPPGSLDVPRLNGIRTPLFGLDLERPSYYDLSVGGRVELWRDTVFGMVNLVVPINRDGVRASVVPLVGLEVVF